MIKGFLLLLSVFQSNFFIKLISEMIEFESFVFEHQSTSNRTSVYKISLWFLLFIFLIVTFCAIFFLFQYLKFSKNDSIYVDKSGVQNNSDFLTTTIVPSTFTTTIIVNKSVEYHEKARLVECQFDVCKTI